MPSRSSSCQKWRQRHPSAVAVRAIDADEWELFRELRLEALREAPYAFGTTFAEWQGDADTEARWRERLTTVPYNLVAYLDGVAAGIVSGTALDVGGTAELISMWVAPFARGHRVGDALVSAVVAWADEQSAARLSLAVVESNAPATALYRRHGFVDDGAVDCRNTGVASERRMILDLPVR